MKQGFEAAPLDVLVKRARLQLERDGEATPVSDPGASGHARLSDGPAPPSEAPDFLSSRASGASTRRPTPDDPFQDVASRAELDWEKEIPIQAEDAPFRSAIIPIPHKARGPLEISSPIDAPPRPRRSRSCHRPPRRSRSRSWSWTSRRIRRRRRPKRPRLPRRSPGSRLPNKCRRRTRRPSRGPGPRPLSRRPKRRCRAPRSCPRPPFRS